MFGSGTTIECCLQFIDYLAEQKIDPDVKPYLIVSDLHININNILSQVQMDNHKSHLNGEVMALIRQHFVPLLFPSKSLLL